MTIRIGPTVRSRAPDHNDPNVPRPGRIAGDDGRVARRESIPADAFLAPWPPPLRSVAEALGDLVRETVPDAVELVRLGWGVVGFDVPVRGGTRLFAFVWPEPAHVHLGFPYGVLVHDPRRLLEGAGVTKRTRWVTLEPGSRPDASLLGPLVVEAARVARLPAGERRLALHATAEGAIASPTAAHLPPDGPIGVRAAAVSASGSRGSGGRRRRS
jgi:hypothetical protein